MSSHSWRLRVCCFLDCTVFVMWHILTTWSQEGCTIFGATHWRLHICIHNLWIIKYDNIDNHVCFNLNFYLFHVTWLDFDSCARFSRAKFCCTSHWKTCFSHTECNARFIENLVFEHVAPLQLGNKVWFIKTGCHGNSNRLPVRTAHI